MAFVSVITPAYGAEDTLARTVKSLLAQTHADWEMIVIADDGCDYGALLQSQGIADPRLRFATTGKTGAGPSAARNIGIERAAHDIVAHLDADDCYSPEYLSRIIPAVEIHNACTTAIRIVDAQTGEALPLPGDVPPQGLLLMPQLLRYTLCYANLAIRRSRCRARWPEALHYGEDLLFWLMLLDELPGIAYVPSARYDYYFRKGSLSRPSEPTTHGLCERRQAMIEWLESYPFANGGAVAGQAKVWLQNLNDMESTFNYRLAEMDAYVNERNRRYERVFGFLKSASG